MVIRAGYGWFFDTNNVTNFDINQTGYSLATAPQITPDNGATFATTLKDPFPLRADGTRFNEPLKNALGSMGLAGGSVSVADPDWKANFQQRWRLSLQYELSRNVVFEIGYTGSFSKTNVARRLDPLPQQYWATGTVRNSAVDTAMSATATNPLRILRNFSLLKENSLKAQLSIDMLNALNKTNFAAPNVDPRSTSFGRVSAQRGLSRIIQINLRFLF